MRENRRLRVADGGPLPNGLRQDAPDQGSLNQEVPINPAARNASAIDAKAAGKMLQDQLQSMKRIDPVDHLQEQMKYRRVLVVRDMTDAIERTQGEKAALDFSFKEMKESQLAQKELQLYEKL